MRDDLLRCIKEFAGHAGNSAHPAAIDLKPFCKGGLAMRLHTHKGGISPEHINLAVMIVLLAAMGLAIFWYGESFQVPVHHLTAVPTNTPL
jgi:hypothetical protein